MDSKLFTIPEAGPQSIAMQNLDRNAAGDRAWRLPPEDMAPPRTACDRITRAWSPSRTLGSLCSTGRGHIAALDGIRAMACVWVVADHCAQALYGGADGLEDAWRSTPSAWLVLNGELAVDVFFVLSGFLVFRILAQYLSSIEDGGDGLTASHAWFRFMSRRWLRIFPAYVVAAAIYTPRSASCKRGGVIWNLLFVNNVLGDQDCMGHTWSIAAEMQMYAFSPAVVMAMLSTRSALLVPAVFTALHIAITAVSMFLIAGPGAHYDPARTGTVFDNVHIKDMYDKPYTRCAPYVMGMAAAAWLHFHTPWRLHNSRESQGNGVENESEATGLAVAYSPVTVDETLDVKEVAGGHMGGESTGAGGENGVNCTLGVLATVVFLAAAVVGTGTSHPRAFLFFIFIYFSALVFAILPYACDSF